MAKTNVINKEYEELQKKIISLSGKWYEGLSNHTLVQESAKELSITPVIPQLNLNIDLDVYHSFIKELIDLLKEQQPALEAELGKLSEVLDTAVLKKWADAAIEINTFYFSSFAEKHGVAEWLPQFVAETAIRPFMKKAQAELKESLKELDHNHGCPACGEPARFAIVGKSGKKEITCPRCHYAWEQKKISCAHCGSEDHENQVILKVEGEESAQVHACKSCNGYTKVVDTKRLIDTAAPELLDLRTIHLDFIAQEKGFGIDKGTEVN